jgi:uncharacterized protein (UPF0548 family)
MWHLFRPRAASLDELLTRVAKQSLSYPEIGMSRGGLEVPSHYGREEHRVELAIAFDAAKDALASFATHSLPYMFLHPKSARVREGLDVIVCARIGPAWSVNPCRVVWVEDSADRFAFAYGTLPGHAESGEEMFAVERRADGRVTAETIAYARPLDPLARLGRPVAHRVQRRIKVDYMRALADHAKRD